MATGPDPRGRRGVEHGDIPRACICAVRSLGALVYRKHTQHPPLPPAQVQ